MPAEATDNISPIAAILTNALTPQPVTASGEPLTFTAADADLGLRLDQFLARQTEFSRARLQRWLKAGLILVNGRGAAARYRVRAGDRVTVQVPPPEPSSLTPEARPLEVVFEDEDLIVLNKPAGVVVHPGAGNRQGTLLNALLAHCPELQDIGDVSRPGLVHRLDQDTSGLMVVAKTALAHAGLVRQFQVRQVEKTYVALVWGRFQVKAGEIVKDIGRHPSERRKMSVHARRGKAAATGWRVLREFPGPLTLAELTPKTGRTHQLRVHLASMGHPVAGDAAYGGGAARFKDQPKLKELKPLVTRQLLHAWKLGFTHPRTGEAVAFEAPLPEDFQAVVDKLENLN